MAFNGAGIYSPPATDFPAVSNTLIQATKFNNVINDIATGLSTCLTKDGQQTVTANIPFAGFYATNVGVRHIAGAVGTPGLAWNDDPSSGFYRIGLNDYGYAVAGVKVQETTAAAHTLSQNLLFSPDNTYDFGAVGATRARDFFLGRNATIGGTTTLSGALTYGGVTLANAVTGTGNMVLSANSTLTGTTNGATFTASAQFDNGGVQGATKGIVLGGLGSTYGRIIESANDTWQIGTSATRTGAVTSAIQWTGTATTIGGNLTVSGTGPHAIGGATDARYQFLLEGAFTAAGAGESAFEIASAITSAANQDISGLHIGMTWVRPGSGTTANFASMRIAAPSIGGSATTVTNGTSLLIDGAPSVGTNQRALWVATGLSQFDSSATPAIKMGGGAGAYVAPAGNGEGYLYAISTGGAVIYGQGSATDFNLLNKSGSVVFNVATGTTTAAFQGAITVSGATTLSSALTYGGVTLTNAVTGTGNMVLSASPTFTGNVQGIIVEGTPVATTSGTTASYTGLPAGIKRIVLSLKGVSTNGTSSFMVQLSQSATFKTAGYNGGAVASGGASTAAAGAGLPITVNATAANTYKGCVILTRESSSNNTWAYVANIYTESGVNTPSDFYTCAGEVSLAGTLDGIRLTSVTPDTFDLGEINIQYQF